MSPADTAQLIELATFITGYFAIGGVISLIAGSIIHHSNDIERD